MIDEVSNFGSRPFFFGAYLKNAVQLSRLPVFFSPLYFLNRFKLIVSNSSFKTIVQNRRVKKINRDLCLFVRGNVHAKNKFTIVRVEILPCSFIFARRFRNFKIRTLVIFERYLLSRGDLNDFNTLVFKNFWENFDFF